METRHSQTNKTRKHAWLGLIWLVYTLLQRSPHVDMLDFAFRFGLTMDKVVYMNIKLCLDMDPQRAMKHPAGIRSFQSAPNSIDFVYCSSPS